MSFGQATTKWATSRRSASATCCGSGFREEAVVHPDPAPPAQQKAVHAVTRHLDQFAAKRPQDAPGASMTLL